MGMGTKGAPRRRQAVQASSSAGAQPSHATSTCSAHKAAADHTTSLTIAHARTCKASSTHHVMGVHAKAKVQLHGNGLEAVL